MDDPGALSAIDVHLYGHHTQQLVGIIFVNCPAQAIPVSYQRLMYTYTVACEAI